MSDFTLTDSHLEKAKLRGLFLEDLAPLAIPSEDTVFPYSSIVVRNTLFSIMGDGAVPNSGTCIDMRGVDDSYIYNSDFSKCGESAPSTSRGNGIHVRRSRYTWISWNRFLDMEAPTTGGGYPILIGEIEHCCFSVFLVSAIFPLFFPFLFFKTFSLFFFR